eukprot:g4622.t1
MSSQETERQKVQRLKGECEKLLDNITELDTKLKDQENVLEDIEAKEAVWRKELSASMEELAGLDNKIKSHERRIENLSEKSGLRGGRGKLSAKNTAIEDLESLLRAANEIQESDAVESAEKGKPKLSRTQMRAAVVYAAIKRLKRSALSDTGKNAPSMGAASSSNLEQWRKKKGVASKTDDGERSICVMFGGRSCVFAIDNTTKFIDVLRQACEYWSLPCTGVLLLDKNQNAYPLHDLIFECPEGVPENVALKQCMIRDQPDKFGRGGGDEDGEDGMGGSTAGRPGATKLEADEDEDEDGVGASRNRLALGPKRNSVDILKYSEMFLYLVSVTLYVVSTFISLNVDEVAPLHDAVYTNLFRTEFVSTTTNVETVFSEISAEAEFWQWVEGPLLAAVSTDGTSTGSLDCPSSYTSIDTSTTEGSEYGTICYPNATGFNFTSTSSVCDAGRLVAFVANESCLLVPGQSFSYQQTSLYQDASCQVVNSADDATGVVCDTTLGYYSLLRFNHLQGPVAIRQYRVQGELDASNETSCPQPFVAPGFLQLTPKQCFPPYEYDRASTSVTDVSTIFPSYSGACSSSANCTFLACTSSGGTQWSTGEPAQLLTIGGSYVEGCTFDALLSPDSTNFAHVVTQIKGTGWLDERTRALRTTANFYNPSLDVVVVVNALCEFTAGGSVNCVPSVTVIPVKTSTMDFELRVEIAVLCLLSLQFCLSMYRLSQMGCARFFGLKSSSALVTPIDFGEGESQASRDAVRKLDDGPDYAAISRYRDGGGDAAGGGDGGKKRKEKDGSGVRDQYGTALNVLDIVAFALVLTSIVMNSVYRNQSMSYYEGYDGGTTNAGFQFNTVLANLYRYVDMVELSRLYTVAMQVKAWAVFALVFKVLKYLNLHPQLSLLFNAVGMATTELFNILLLVIVVTVSVTLPLWYVCATNVGDVRFRYYSSVFTDFHSIFEISSYMNGNSIETMFVARVFWVLYIFMVAVLYGSICATILSESYVYLLNRVSRDGYYWFSS